MRLCVFIAIGLFIASCTGHKNDDTKTNADQAKVTETATAFFNLLKGQKISKAVEYLHPKVFELTPKETMIEQLAKIATDTELQFIFDDFEIFKVSDKMTEGDKEYLKVDFIATTKVRLISDSFQAMAHDMVHSFEDKAGKDNVVFDEASHTFKVRQANKLLAIKAVGEKEWKLLEYNAEYHILFDQFVPASVREKFGFTLESL